MPGHGGYANLVRWHAPLRVGAAYIVFGVLWILLSDALLLSLAPDLARVRFYGLVKAIAFVTLSAVLLVVLLEREQRALRRREAQFRGTFEEASVGITHIGADRHWLEVNQRFCEIVGYTKEELQRLTFDDLTVPEDRESDTTAFDELMAGKRGPYRLEKRYRRKDGNTVWVTLNRSLQRNDDGSVYCITVVTDITALKLAEAALRDSEERLRLAVESARLLAWQANPRTGEVVWDNPDESWGIKPQTRTTADELMSRVHPDDRARVRQAIGRSMEPSGDGQYSADYRLLRPDGVYRWISARGKTFFATVDGVRQAVRSAGVSTDITEQKEAEEAIRESESRFRTLADNISQLAWMADGAGEIFWYNQRWYDFTGTTPQAMENQGWKKVVHPEHLDGLIQKMRHCFAAGEVLEDTFPMRRYDGEYRWFLTRAVPIRDEQGRIYRWLGTNTDITDELSAARALQEANQAKDRFLAVLSHELRTPLTPVIATLSALEQEPGITDAVRDELRVIQRNVELEARLIDDLLDLTRVSRGKITLDRRPVNLCTVLNHVAEICAQDIEARELHFGIKCQPNPIMIEGDPARLRQVFWNLLKNATKFTPRGGCIGIFTHREGEYGVIEITDSGRGIAPEMLPRIFNAFEQGGNEITRRHGGLGLGLAICKTMVELHGGSIEAHSEGVGKGARFVVRLPMLRDADIPTVEAAVKPRRRPGHEGLEVLLVEDHGDTARILRRVLSAHGHHVQTAGDLATAIQATQERDFDVIVSDLGLPDGTGMDLVEEIRRSGKTVPAIAMSGYGQEEDIRRSREAGFSEHLVKPVDVRRLEEAIGRAVAEREWRSE